MEPPSDDIVSGFGVPGRPVRLAGGEGVAWLVDGVVLKPVIDVHETEWTHALMDRVVPDDFRIADPVRSVAGGWVHRGWAATRFVPDLRPAAPDWPFVCAAGLRFGDAVERVREDGHDVLSARTHRWAVADRVAWGEDVVPLDDRAADVFDEILSHAGAPVGDRQFVHGDLSGNVFVDASGMPVILDVSPYLRPRGWAAAIVTADAVLWSGADLELVRRFVVDAAHRDLFARALIFRLIAEQLADAPRHGAALEPYGHVLTALP